MEGGARGGVSKEREMEAVKGMKIRIAVLVRGFLNCEGVGKDLLMRQTYRL